MFLLAPLSFSTIQTALKELPFCISCQFNSVHLSPWAGLSSSISFLCCTGAEHYVNLVIGTGPSPLYGFLSSRSTWLVKEDGMKINEVQLIQGGGVPLQHFHWGDSTDQQQSAPSLAVSLHLFFFILPVLTHELWTLHLCCKATASLIDVATAVSLFPLNWALQNRFSSTIHASCQQIEWQGKPLCRFI